MKRRMIRVLLSIAFAMVISIEASPGSAGPASFGMLGFATFGHNQGIGLVGLNPQPIPPGLIYHKGSHVVFLYPSCSRVTVSSTGRTFVATGKASDHRYYQIRIIDDRGGMYPDSVGVGSSVHPPSPCRVSVPTQLVNTGGFYIYPLAR